MKLCALFSLLYVVADAFSFSSVNTCDRLAIHGYPCESHLVQTSDGYKLTMFRIPYSHNLRNQKKANKIAILVMHGIFCSSDTWLLNGPDNSLPIILADAGYDVWLGNNRGNIYAQQHVSMTPSTPSFWDYSFHEIGVYDIATKLDFIRYATNQTKIHFVSHSQASASYLSLMSLRPKYSEMIKTTHLLSPPVYLKHTNWILARILSPLFGKPSLIGNAIGKSRIPLVREGTNFLLPPICAKEQLVDLCRNLLFIVMGGWSPYLNNTVLIEFFKMHPYDSSIREIQHLFQIRQSNIFRQYDRGLTTNLATYGTEEPPSYNFANINLQTPIDIYYADNDYVASATDVEHLLAKLGDKAVGHHIDYAKHPDFNHFDFLYATTVKEVINDCVLDKINVYEGKPSKGLCTAFTD